MKILSPYENSLFKSLLNGNFWSSQAFLCVFQIDDERTMKVVAYIILVLFRSTRHPLSIIDQCRIVNDDR